jgi:anti-anti-sigma regulatory factor
MGHNDEETSSEEVHSPFDIEKAADGILQVAIHGNFSLGSLAALAAEAKEFCAEKRSGLRFDFGQVTTLDSRVLLALNALLYDLHQSCGGVSAMVGNARLTKLVQEEQEKTGKLEFFSLLLAEK